MNRRLVLIALSASALLAGCQTAPAPKLIEHDPVDGLIAQNATAATQALRELSESSGGSRVVAPAKGATHPVTPVSAAGSADSAFTLPPATTIASRRASIAVEELAPPPAVLPNGSGVVSSGGLLSTPPAGLDRKITVRWTGELEQLVARIAQETGWKVGDSTGLRVAPVVISINADDRSAFDVLRDIGAMAGTSADILVTAATKTISVRYPQR